MASVQRPCDEGEVGKGRPFSNPSGNGAGVTPAAITDTGTAASVQTQYALPVSAATDLAYRLRFVLCLIFLTILQYGIVGPSVQFIVLSFFAAPHGGGDCNAMPESKPCRQAASDAAAYHGTAYFLTSGLEFCTALTLGSYSDIVGRRPLFRAKAVLSVVPIGALALHVFAGGTLWAFLVVCPIYEAVDINGVFLATMSDVVVEPHLRTSAFSMLFLCVFIAVGMVLPFAGMLSANVTLFVALGACVGKVAFVYIFFPETARLATDWDWPHSPWDTITAAVDLLGRNHFIFRMVLVLVVSGLSAAGVGTVLPPYLTAYLGVDKAVGVELVIIGGLSVVVALAFGLRPLLAHLSEVRALQVCMAAATVFPALLAGCSDVWHVFVLTAVFAGPIVLQFPIIAGIKSNLVDDEDQGLLQGALASIRVAAVAVSHLFFGWFYRYATSNGAASSRTAALPPLLVAVALSALALVVASTLPEELPQLHQQRQKIDMGPAASSTDAHGGRSFTFGYILGIAASG